MIKLENVTKVYGEEEVLKDITYTFEDGLIYLIKGHNGSGKSTLLKIILGLVKPTSGKLHKSSLKVGYIPEKGLFPAFLRVDEFLYGLATLEDNHFPLREVDLLIKEWNLDPKKKIINLSKGNQQKVLIVQALITRAKIFIFDEALSGLDKERQKQFVEAILKLKKDDTVIIISSHYDKYYLNVSDVVLELQEGNLKVCALLDGSSSSSLTD